MILSSTDNYFKKIINQTKSSTIIFASYFNDHIEEDFFPEHIEKIIFGYKSNVPNYDYQPDQIIWKEDLISDVYSYSKFNSKSINNFGSNTNIKWIIFPEDSTFNQNLTSLPKKLEFLSLGNSYTKSLVNLPTTLKYFILSTQHYIQDISIISDKIEYFGLKTSNDMILNKLPITTKYLNLDTWRYNNIVIGNNQSLDMLPDSIDTLQLNCSYNSKLKNLPTNLKKLYISNLCTLDTLSNLPESLELLDIYFSSNIHNNDHGPSYFSNLPSKLKNLKITTSFVYHSKSKPKLCLDNLPESIIKLSIGTYLHNGIFDNLPGCIEEFEAINCVLYDLDNLNNLDNSDNSDNSTNSTNSEFLFFNNLPRNLKYLKISINKHCKNKNQNNKLSNLPVSLKKIIIPKWLNIDPDKNYDKSICDENNDLIEFVKIE
jgi:hypothetical protein